MRVRAAGKLPLAAAIAPANGPAPGAGGWSLSFEGTLPAHPVKLATPSAAATIATTKRQ